MRQIIAERKSLWLLQKLALLIFVILGVGPQVHAAANRSTYIPYDSPWIGSPDYSWIAFDSIHQQIFTAWGALDRVDVLSATDYHLIRSIVVPSPSTLDISPDGSTLAVGTSGAHVLFFDTGTFAKTNDIFLRESALGITAFVYTANGNAFVRAIEGLSTGGGITVYWDHVANSFSNGSSIAGTQGGYQTTGPIARSGDYSRIALGDANSSGNVQILDGNTGQPVQQLAYGGYIDALAVNKDASRYAVCVEPAGTPQVLVILDSSFNSLYQDSAGCYGIAFNAQGDTLYRDAFINSAGTTQSIAMSTFAASNTTNYFTQGAFASHWQAADATGMVYGMNSLTPGDTVFVAVDTTMPATPAIPAVSDPLKIVRVINNIGSPQGGDLIQILCTGMDNVSAGSVSVTIGGAAATGVVIAPSAPLGSLPNLRLLTVKTPAGAAGLADVTIHAGSGSDTAIKGFQYAQGSKVYPFPTSPNFLLYDSLRQKLYAAHKDQVEVIDPIAQQVVTPLVPVSGKLPTSQFAGLSLSPDGNRLYIADAGANLIHVLNLNNLGTGTSIDPAKAIGVSTPISPGRVFETSTGLIIGSNNNLFTINPATGSGAWILDTQGNQVGGYLWSSTNKGENFLITHEVNGLISSRVGLWSALTSLYTPSANETEFLLEAAANEDGTVIAAGGSTAGSQDTNPDIVDFDLNALGFLEDHFDVPTPWGTPSFFFHPSGALLYSAGPSVVGGSVELDDLHQWQASSSITFPEPLITSDSPFTDHMLEIDPTGRYLFGVTQSGITVMVLNTIPLSIGNLRPAFGQPSGGQNVTLRGSGFQSGAVASFGGQAAATTFVDENTLTATLPALSSGWQDVTVANTNGISYTAPGLFQVLGSQLTPAITGFSPASVIVQSGIPGFDMPQTVTVVGSGFDAYDTIEINGEPVDSGFVDTSHLEATIPATLTGQTGSIAFAVISPYKGPSNSLPLPMINPVPVIDSILPPTMETGGPNRVLTVNGKGLVAGSVIQWNGQSTPSQLTEGETSSGEESAFATIPASLLTTSKTVTITVFNPPPGGGTSNPLSLDVSPAHPLVSYPASVDFGSVLLNTPATQAVQLQNLGTAPYNLTSATITPAPFSRQPYTCSNVAYNGVCPVQLQFSPVTVGAFTATLTITDNAAGSPHVIPVTGTGVRVPAPMVTLTSIDFLEETVSAGLEGTTVVGGPSVPGTAWIEYGTDPALGTYTESPTWTFTGDNRISGSIGGLSAFTGYAARLAVQTAGGTGKSAIGLFTTEVATPSIALVLAKGASNVATVRAGQTATYQLLASDGGNGYAGTASFSCGPVPTGAPCSVTPSTASITVNGAPITVTITTAAASTAALAWSFGLLLGTGAIAFRKRLRGLGMFMCLLGVTMLVASCGGSGSSSGAGGSTPPPPSTTAGTYNVTINASAGEAQTSYLLTLTVQ